MAYYVVARQYMFQCLQDGDNTCKCGVLLVNEIIIKLSNNIELAFLKYIYKKKAIDKIAD